MNYSDFMKTPKVLVFEKLRSERISIVLKKTNNVNLFGDVGTKYHIRDLVILQNNLINGWEWYKLENFKDEDKYEYIINCINNYILDKLNIIDTVFDIYQKQDTEYVLYEKFIWWNDLQCFANQINDKVILSIIDNEVFANNKYKIIYGLQKEFKDIFLIKLKNSELIINPK